MTPEEEAVQDIEFLIDDIYKEILSWVPSWLGKKVMPPNRKRALAKRIMKISKKYVEAKNGSTENRVLEKS